MNRRPQIPFWLVFATTVNMASVGFNDTVTGPSGSAETQCADGEPVPRLPIPTQRQQKAAEQEIRGVFGQELTDARDTEQKLAIAEKLRKLDVAAADDPAARYVLLRLAGSLALQAGALHEAVAVAETLEREYEIKAVDLKVAIAANLLNCLQSNTRQAAGSTSAEELLKLTRSCIEQAIAVDDYALANRAVDLATRAARIAQDAEAARQILNQKREIQRLKTSYAKIKRSVEALSRSPDDHRIKLEVGRWYCFRKGDWHRGLNLLEQSSDASLANVAGRDLLAPTDYAEQIELAGAWRASAGKLSGVERAAAESRAEHWFGLAWPSMSRILADDEYELAILLVDRALVAARQSGDRERMQHLSGQRRGILKRQAEFLLVQAALSELSAGALDRDAAYTVGKWYCLSKGQWAKGLPYAAKGRHRKFSELATQELENPAAAEEILALAHGWWQLAESEFETREQTVMREHAVDLYETVVAKLSGLAKTELEKRLARVKRTVSQIVDKSGNGHHAIPHGFSDALAEWEGRRFDGKQYVALDQDLLDNATQGTVFVRFTRGRWPEESSTIISKGNGVAWVHNHLQIARTAQSPNMIHCTISDNVSSTANNVELGPIEEGIEYTIAMTWDGSMLKGYLNGTVLASSPASISLPSDSTHFSIGKGDPTTSRFFRGSIKEVRLYDRNLSQAEITYLHAKGTGGKDPGEGNSVGQWEL